MGLKESYLIIHTHIWFAGFKLKFRQKLNVKATKSFSFSIVLSFSVFKLKLKQKFNVKVTYSFSFSISMLAPTESSIFPLTWNIIVL